MKEKDFKVIKTEKEFQRNYNLHDLAEAAGTKILKAKGYSTRVFGEDRRYEAVWEAGEDKPDCFVVKSSNTESNLCLLDWKGKKSDGFMINERAYNSYIKICNSIKLPLIIAMAKINNSNEITSFVYFILPNTEIVAGKKTMWDKNVVVEFKANFKKDFNEVEKYLATL